MVKRILIMILCLGAGFTFGQNSSQFNKITLSTFQMLKGLNSDDLVPVLIQGDVAEIQNYIRLEGGSIKFSAGDIVSANLSKATIEQLNKQAFVSKIDCAPGKLELMNDVMVIRNNVDSAYYGYWPLDQAYDGTGVVIGMIDAPFAIEHADFTDDLGNSRIKYVWDQNAIDDGTSPDPYNYGIECDSLSIANGTCPHTDTFEGNYSHGSGTTGVAASSGNATNHYRGVAPNADLILVNINFGENYLTNVTDAVAYIYEKAAEMNKPCVINTSIGGYAGSHDGRDLVAQTIDNLIGASNGRALVAAAGNAGHIAFHLGYPVTATEKFTWFKKLSYTNLVYFQLFADEAEFNEVYFSIAADNPAGWMPVGETPDFNVLNDFDLEGGLIDSVEFTIPGGGNGEIYAQLLDGVYELNVEITPDDPSYFWRYSTHGTGYFDMWSMESTTGYSNYVTTGLPDAITLPEIVNYVLPNQEQTIVSSWQCSDKVITVGSYVNRDTLTNYYGENSPIFDTPETLFYTSSHGPTRDGRIKPDICATGARVVSTAAEILINYLIEEGAAVNVAQDAMHYMYNGTSFSSPVVTGIAALYFQQNPNADYQEVKDAILNNAKHDAFTGDALPDNLWGYGKADAFRTLTGPWGCSAEDHTAPPQHVVLGGLTSTKALIQWDLIPNAVGYQVIYQPTGGAVIKKKSVLNQRMLSGLTPNTTYTCRVRAYCDGYGLSDNSDLLVFTTPPLREGENELIQLLIYPNPASDLIYVDGTSENETVSIYNMLGELVFTTNATDELLEIQTDQFPGGIYQVIIHDGDQSASQLFIINK